MKHFNKILNALVLLSFLVAFGAYAAAADKKPMGTTAKEYAVTTAVKNGKVVITAKGQGGYHCNTLYPWKLTVSDKTYTKKDAAKFAEDGVVFKIAPVKDQKATLKFSVCNDKQCIMETASLSW